MEELRARAWNLSIPLYVRPSSGNGAADAQADRPLLADAIEEWRKSCATLRASMVELFKTLKEDGLG